MIKFIKSFFKDDEKVVGLCAFRKITYRKPVKFQNIFATNYEKNVLLV